MSKKGTTNKKSTSEMESTNYENSSSEGQLISMLSKLLVGGGMGRSGPKAPEFDAKDPGGWLLELEFVLIQKQMLSLVEGKETVENSGLQPAVFDQRRLQAYAVLGQALGPHLRHVILQDSETRDPVEIYRKIKAYVRRNDSVNKLFSIREFFNSKMETDQTMESHVNAVVTKANRLRNVNVAIPDEFLIAVLLNSVSFESYGPVISAIEARDVDTVTVDFVVERLLAAEARRGVYSTEPKSTSFAAAAAASTSPAAGTTSRLCCFCNEPGHLKGTATNTKLGWLESSNRILPLRRQR